MTTADARALFRARAAMMDGCDDRRMVGALRALAAVRRTRVSSPWAVELVLADALMEASCGVDGTAERIAAVEAVVRSDLARLAGPIYGATAARRRWADRMANALREACPGAAR